jgi:methylglyoxal synthase
MTGILLSPAARCYLKVVSARSGELGGDAQACAYFGGSTREKAAR